MEIYDLFEENELDTYIRREVPVLEGDEAQSLTQKELGQGQEDHCWFSHESTCTTSVFTTDTKRDVWFLNQAIWRKEHTSEYDLKKQIGESHLEWTPRIMGFIHAKNVCQKEVITFSWLWEEEEARFIRREEEDGSNWRSISHHSKKIPQAIRNMKNSILEEPIIHLITWIRNDGFMNEEDDK